MMIRTVLTFATAFLLAACGAGSGLSGSSTGLPSTNDPREIAIQQLLDSHPPKAPVAKNHICAFKKTVDPQKYNRVPGAHVKADGTERSFGAIAKCYTVSWDASVPITVERSCPMCMGSAPMTKIGRLVVDKIGDEQDGPLGTKVTPYKAHFEANDLGAKLIALGLAERPSDITDGQASLHKDADGNWVAR